MKDAVLTVRLPLATRRRVERLARRQRRSLSQQVECLIEQAMAQAMAASGSSSPAPSRGARRLAGSLAGGMVPTAADFRQVRGVLSAALDARSRSDARLRR